MKGKLFVLAAMISAVMLTGCTKSQDAVIEKSQKYEFEIGTFDDFRYLMFTDGDGHVIRDKDGNEYYLGDDGYYHDENGRRIKDYGAGDLDTAENYEALGAKLKSQASKGGSGNDGDGNGSNGSGGHINADGSIAVDNPSGGNTNLQDLVDDKDMVINDWGEYKKKMMEEAGIAPTTEKPWYDDYVEKDDLDNIVIDNNNEDPQEKLQSNSTYNTVVDVGGGVPGQLHVDKLSVGNNASISGSITIDANAFEEYMRKTYGDKQIDENGNEVDADYKSYLNTLAMDIKFVVADYGWMDTRYISAGDLYFDDNYKLSFNLNADVPEGYAVYFYIQGVPYAIQ